MIDARVERLHDWFALQIDFVDALVARTQLPFVDALTFNTNLHRRFGFGRPDNANASREWRDYARRMAAMRTRAERIECTRVFARERFVGWSGTGEGQFGCFSFEVQNDDVIRLHFSPNDMDAGVGPLTRQKFARRV